MPTGNLVSNLKILATVVHLLIPEDSCSFQMQNILTFSQGSQEFHPLSTVKISLSKSPKPDMD